MQRRILRDKPVQSDAFSGGGHDRTALILQKTLDDLSDRDAVVGVDGKWGSGKSSVIEMAEKKLGPCWHFYTYDLWANQSIEFRRGFLEGFLAWAEGKKDFSRHAQDISDLRDRLGAKSKEITNTTKGQYNLFGLMAIVAALLSPLIYFWLSPIAVRMPPFSPTVGGKQDAEISFWSMIINNGSLIALAVVAVFFLVTVGRISYFVCFGSSFSEATSDALHLFSKKTETEVNTELIRDVDPTSYEFSKTFRELCSKLSINDAKIAVVFDNIDRLNADRVVTAWSDVQSVVGHANLQAIEQSPLSIVVPFDRSSIMKALVGKAANDKGEGSFGQDRSATLPGADDEDGEDLFRKSFDIVVTVSQPVISDLKTFFQSQLQKALVDGVSDQVSERVLKIFDHAVVASGRAPTPRWINSFINDLTTIWLQWDGDIPLDVAAVYVANREAIERNRDPQAISAIAKGSYSLRVECTADRLEEFLAMVAYSAPRDLALEVMLAAPIYRALISDTPSDLAELATSPAFNQMLPRVAEMRIEEISRETASYNRAVANLLAIDPMGNKHSETGQLLESAITSVEPVAPSAIGAHSDILMTPRFAHPRKVNEAIDRVWSWLNSGAVRTESDDEEAGKMWIAAIGILKVNLAEFLPDVEWLTVQKRIPIPQGAPFVCGVASDCGEAQVSLRDFKLGASLSGVSDHLSQLIDKKRTDLVWHIKELGPVLSAADLNTLRVRMIASLTGRAADQFESSGNIDDEFSILGEIFKHAPARKTIPEVNEFLLKGEFVFHLFKKYSSETATKWIEQEFYLFAYILLLFGNGRISISDPNPQLNEINEATTWLQSFVDGDSFPDGFEVGIAAAVRHLKLDVEFLRLAVDKKCVRPLLKSLGRAAMSGHPPLIFNATDFVKNFSVLKSLAADDPALIGRYGQHHERKDEPWKSVEAINLPVELVRFESEADGAFRWPVLMQKLDEAVLAKDAAGWRSGLNESEAWLELAAIRIEHGGLKLPINSFKEPFVAHLVSVATGAESPSIVANALFNGLPHQSRASAANDILRRLAGQSATSEGVASLLHIAPSVVAKIDISGNAAAAFEVILRRILEAPNSETVDFIESRSADFRAALSNLEEAQIDEAVAILSSLADTPEISALRDRLAAALKVQLPHPSPPGDDDASDLGE